MNDSSKSGLNPGIEDLIPTQRQEIDLSLLPDLPPPEFRVWGRSRHGGRARWFGCGCFVKVGREVLDDRVVDSSEIDQLNRLLDEELQLRVGKAEP